MLKTGTLERFLRISESATPLTKDPSGRLVQLASLIGEEITNDKIYFERPFAADANIVSLTSGIYLKYFTLEMENMFSTVLQTVNLESQSDKQQLEVIMKSPTNIFELYYSIRELQEKYLSLVVEDDSTQSNLKETFSVHRWLSPYIQMWLISSEDSMMKWVDSAVQADKFEAINAEADVLHSTSVIDLFYSFNQMMECLKKLDWDVAGGAASEEEATMRKMHWCLFLTRYSRTLGRGLAKYGENLSNQVVNERLQFLKDYQSKNKVMGDNLEMAIGSLLSPTKKLANSSTKNLENKAEWIAGTDTTGRLCVKVNNIEAARLQLNDIYDELKID